MPRPDEGAFYHLHFSYDDSGAVLTEQALRYGVNATLVTTYTHDADGNVDSILYPRGDKPWFTYDNRERCTQVVLNGATLCGQYAYAPGTDWQAVRNLPYVNLATAYYYRTKDGCATTGTSTTLPTHQ